MGGGWGFVDGGAECLNVHYSIRMHRQVVLFSGCKFLYILCYELINGLFFKFFPSLAASHSSCFIPCFCITVMLYLDDVLALSSGKFFISQYSTFIAVFFPLVIKLIFL